VLNLVTTLTLSRLVRRITWYVSIHMAKSWCLGKFNGRLSLRMQQDVSRTVLPVFVALIPLFWYLFLHFCLGWTTNVVGLCRFGMSGRMEFAHDISIYIYIHCQWIQSHVCLPCLFLVRIAFHFFEGHKSIPAMKPGMIWLGHAWPGILSQLPTSPILKHPKTMTESGMFKIHG
jgi:hypothetical protein